MLGGPQSSVRETFGNPARDLPVADGTQRLDLFEEQPYGFEVYAADFDAASKPDGFRQALTEKEIYEARPGDLDQRDIAERFGLPREHCAALRPDERARRWSYRMYMATAACRRASTPFFDDAGVLDRTMIITGFRASGDRKPLK